VNCARSAARSGDEPVINGGYCWETRRYSGGIAEIVAWFFERRPRMRSNCGWNLKQLEGFAEPGPLCAELMGSRRGAKVKFVSGRRCGHRAMKCLRPPRTIYGRNGRTSLAAGSPRWLSKLLVVRPFSELEPDWRRSGRLSVKTEYLATMEKHGFLHRAVCRNPFSEKDSHLGRNFVADGSMGRARSWRVPRTRSATLDLPEIRVSGAGWWTKEVGVKANVKVRKN